MWFLAGLISRVDAWEGGGWRPSCLDKGDGEVTPLCEERCYECPGCSPLVSACLSTASSPALFYDNLDS
jgi:hypothetical protein